jgi:hypothetical protein
MFISDDFTLDNDNRLVKHNSGSSIYSANALYSYIQDYFDEVAHMTTPLPISAQTPSEYTLINGWFIPENTFKYLRGGSIKTEGWDANLYSNGIFVLKFEALNYIDAIESDIGKSVTDGISTGTLLDYNNDLKKWWVRKDFGDDWTGLVVTEIGEGYVLSFATGENLFANIYTLGLLEQTTTNEVYIEQINPEFTNNLIPQYWNSGHIDLLIKIKEAGTLIDSGLLKIYVREFSDLGSNFTVDLSTGGRNPIPLGTSNDSNNQTSKAVVETWNDVIVTFGNISVDLGDGTGSQTYNVEIDCGLRANIQEVYERLKLITCRESTVFLNGSLGSFYKGAALSYAEVNVSPFCTYAGGKLFGARGVFFKNIPALDRLSVNMISADGSPHSNPYVATGTFLVSPELSADVNAEYCVFFKTNPSGNFGTTNAVKVENADGNSIQGFIQGRSEIGWTFDFDLNSQGGRLPSTEAQVVVVASGLSSGQYISVEGTFTRDQGQSIAVTAQSEKVYSSPLAVKVSFDGVNKLIVVNPDSLSIDVKQDIYSAWKEWLLESDNIKFLSAVRVIGGDPIGGGRYAGDIYFLKNGWRISVNHSCDIEGVLYSDDFPSPFVAASGTQIVTNRVSTIVNLLAPQIIGLSIPTAIENASAVWEHPVSLMTDKTKAGGWLVRKIMTTIKYLGFEK